MPDYAVSGGDPCAVIPFSAALGFECCVQVLLESAVVEFTLLNNFAKRYNCIA